MTRPEALTALLMLPDEPCLHRGYHYTQPASLYRDAARIKRNLGTAYVAWRMQDHADESKVVSVRRQPLRTVCWIATRRKA